MDVKHFNELIEVSQAVCDKANDQIADYCARKYGDAEGDTLEQQLRDYLFVAEESSAYILGNVLAPSERRFTGERDTDIH